MVYRKTKQKVRRIYSRSKSIFGGDLLKNPYFLGIAAGVVKNALSGKKVIDIDNIKNRISKSRWHKPADFIRRRNISEKFPTYGYWSIRDS